MVPKCDRDRLNWNRSFMSPSYSFLYEYREVMFRAAEGARDCKHSTHLAQAFLTRSSWPLFIQMYVYMYAYTDAGDCFYVFFCVCYLLPGFACGYYNTSWKQHVPHPSFASAVWSTFYPKPFNLVTKSVQMWKLLSIPLVAMSADTLRTGCNAVSEAQSLTSGLCKKS